MAACGGAPAEEPEEPVVSDSDQMMTLIQEVYAVEAALAEYNGNKEAIVDGTMTEDEAMTIYSGIKDQAAAALADVEAAQWTDESYAEAVELLNASASSMSQFMDASYDAMVTNDMAAMEAAAPLFETYMTSFGDLMTVMGVEE